MLIDYIAYVGPGPGLSLTWALLGLLATVGAAVFAVLLHPLRVLYRRMRGIAPQAATDLPQAECPVGEPAGEAVQS